MSSPVFPPTSLLAPCKTLPVPRPDPWVLRHFSSMPMLTPWGMWASLTALNITQMLQTLKFIYWDQILPLNSKLRHPTTYSIAFLGCLKDISDLMFPTPDSWCPPRCQPSPAQTYSFHCLLSKFMATPSFRCSGQNPSNDPWYLSLLRHAISDFCQFYSQKSTYVIPEMNECVCVSPNWLLLTASTATLLNQATIICGQRST